MIHHSIDRRTAALFFMRAQCAHVSHNELLLINVHGEAKSLGNLESKSEEIKPLPPRMM